MSEVDKRLRVGRRVVLRGVAGAAPAMAAAAAGVTLPRAAALADAPKNLSPQTMATLVKVARDIFPHDHLDDSFYAAAVAGYDTAAAKPDAKAMLEGGVARLDSDANDRFGAAYAQLPWEENRIAILQGIENTAFFKKLHGDLIATLYNQKAVWPKFGYEGSSADKGGYIHRGFDDIDWLPAS